jgi:hypothetical protein
VGLMKDWTGSFAGGLYGLALFGLISAFVCAFFLHIPSAVGKEAVKTAYDAVFTELKFDASLLADCARSVSRPVHVAAWVKHSPPKRLRNASAMAASGKQNRI